MTTRTRIAITLLASSFALGVAAPASADEPPPPDAAKLTRLVGKWKGKGSYRWGKKTGTLQASWSCRTAAGDAGVLCDFEVSGIEGLPSVIRETDLFGFDNKTQEVRWAWVCSVGGAHEYRAAFEGDTLDMSDATTRTRLTLGGRRIEMHTVAGEGADQIVLDLVLKPAK